MAFDRAVSLDSRKTYSSAPGQAAKNTKNFLGRSGTSVTGLSDVTKNPKWKKVFAACSEKLAADIETSQRGIVFNQELPIVAELFGQLPKALQSELGSPEQVVRDPQKLVGLYDYASQSMGRGDLLKRMRAVQGAVQQGTSRSPGGASGGSNITDYASGGGDTAANTLDLVTEGVPKLRPVGNALGLLQNAATGVGASTSEENPIGDAARWVSRLRTGEAPVQGAPSITGDAQQVESSSVLGPSLVAAGQYGSYAANPMVMPAMMGVAPFIGKLTAHTQASKKLQEINAEIDRATAASNDPTAPPERKAEAQSRVQSLLDSKQEVEKQVPSWAETVGSGAANAAIGTAQSNALTGGNWFKFWNKPLAGQAAAAAPITSVAGRAAALARGLPRAGLVSTLPGNAADLFNMARGDEQLKAKYEQGGEADILAREAAYDQGKGRGYDATRMASMPVNYFINPDKFKAQYTGALLPSMLDDQTYRGYVENLRDKEAIGAGYVPQHRLNMLRTDAIKQLQAALPGADGATLNQLAEHMADRAAMDDVGRLAYGGKGDDTESFNNLKSYISSSLADNPALARRHTDLLAAIGPQMYYRNIVSPDAASSQKLQEAVAAGVQQPFKPRGTYFYEQGLDDEAAAAQSAALARRMESKQRDFESVRKSLTEGVDTDPAAYRGVMASPEGKAFVDRLHQDRWRQHTSNETGRRAQVAATQEARLRTGREQHAAARQATDAYDAKMRDISAQGHANIMKTLELGQAKADARHAQAMTKIKPVQPAAPAQPKTAAVRVFAGAAQFIHKLQTSW